MFKDIVYFIKNISKLKEVIDKRGPDISGKNIHINDNVLIAPDVRICNIDDTDKNQIVISKGANIANQTVIVNNKGYINLGENFRAGIGTHILSFGGSISTGKNVVINNYSVVYGHGGIEIGDNTQIAAHCVLIPANHKIDRFDMPISRQGETKKGIKIGNDVCIDANVTVLDGVNIGDGCVVGAGSVVTKSIPSFSVAVGNPAKVMGNRLKLNLSCIDINIINKVSEEELINKTDLVQKVLAYNSVSTDILDAERAFPGEKRFIESGYYKTMLKRYFFAASTLCIDSDVLDTCCGLGWGAFIVAHYAKHITALDIDKDAIHSCKDKWHVSNVSWIHGDALKLSSFVNRKFDVALGMETIEHFTKEDGEKYVAMVSDVLTEGGVFVGTSAFPDTRNEADELLARNKSHLHIFTLSEMNDILSKYFKDYIIVNNWMFIAQK